MKKSNALHAKTMSYMAMFIAIHLVLQLLGRMIPGQPQGGNINIDLLPIILASYLLGTKCGLLVGIMSTLLQFVLGMASFYGPWSVILDYLVPISIVGLSSSVHNIHFQKKTVYTGIIITMILKFLSHFISGVWLFGAYCPQGMNIYAYSFGYQIIYCLPTAILTYFAFVMVYPRLKAYF